MKLPVWINEKIEDIELEPKGTMSYFAKFSNYVQLTKTLRLIVDIYYELYGLIDQMMSLSTMGIL